MKNLKTNILRLYLMLLLMALTAVSPMALTAVAQMQKMSPMVRHAVMKNEQMAHRQTAAAKGTDAQQAGLAQANGKKMTAFVRTSDKSILKDNGCKVLAEFGDIYIANIPVNRLRSLASSPAVSRIEANYGRKALLDSTAIMANVCPVWDTPAPQPDVNIGMKGTGVVVGVMDIGFDLTHPAYYSEDGSRYRVKALWDQLDLTSNGHPVTGTDTTYIGRQYIGMDELLQKGCSYDGKTMSHGTFTSTQAAGNSLRFVPQAHEALRRSLPYGYDVDAFSGIAPDADICLVANCVGDNVVYIPEENYDYYTSALDALGFKYMFDFADAMGKPCVASFSEGSYTDLYGDDILFAEVLDKMLGSGHILCASAGNESHLNTHMLKPVGKQMAGAFIASSFDAMYVIRSVGEAVFRLTFYDGGGGTTVRDYTVKGTMCDEETGYFPIDTVLVDGICHYVAMASYPSCYNPSEWATELYIFAEDGERISGSVPISLMLVGEDCLAEVFGSGGEFVANAKDPALRDYDSVRNVLSPGALPRVICVGAVNSRYNFITYMDYLETVTWGEKGCHSRFSSVGPAMSGLIKPDVSAPGSLAMGSYSSFFHEEKTSSWDAMSYEWNGREYLWHADCGTSMSCPAVAGVIALWLQECPTLSPEQAMEVIAATSQHPDDFADYDCVTDENGYEHNNVYGYGVIDAYAGLLYIRSHFTGIEELTVPVADKAVYDIMGRRITSPQRGQLYIVNGKKTIGK